LALPFLMLRLLSLCSSTSALYALSLHDALPIWFCSASLRPSASWGGRYWPTSLSPCRCHSVLPSRWSRISTSTVIDTWRCVTSRSEEHTSELQSRVDLVCRLLLEKKKTTRDT